MTSPEAPTLSSRHRAMSYHGYSRLVSAWVFSNIGDSTLLLVLAIWAKDLTDSDAAAALTLALVGLPALASPLLGQLADRVSRRLLLGLAQFVLAAVVLLLLLVRQAHDIWLIYLVTVVYATMAFLTASAQSGLVRDLLPDEALASGNGTLSSIDQGLRLIAPLLGAGAYVVVGPFAIAAFVALMFAVAGCLLLTLRVQESAPDAADVRGTWWVEVSAGFRHLATEPALGRLTVLLAVAFAATGAVSAVIFAVVDVGLGLPASALGVLVGIQGAGSLLAGLTASRSIGRWGEAAVCHTGLVVLGMAVPLFLIPSTLAVALAMFLAGYSVTAVMVAFVTLRQRLTPSNLQGRTSAATQLALNLPQTAALMLGAAALAFIDFRWLVVAAATGVVLTAVASLRPGRRSASAAAAATGDRS